MKSSYEKVFIDKDIPAMIKFADGKELVKQFSAIAPVQIPPHWHRSLEFSYVRKGEITLWINHKKEIIKEKEFILVNSGQMHKIEAVSPEDCQVIIGIISYPFIKANCPDVENLYFNIHKSDVQKERLREIYEHFRWLELHPQEHHKLIMNAHIHEILYILLSHYQEPINRKETHSITFKRHDILDYLEDHYQEEVSLKRISEEFYISEEHFSRSFHQYFGLNFKTYLTNYRLHCSYDDVAQTQNSIQDIALKHGFSNTKAFITAFKRSYGLTPYQFRKQYKLSKKDNLPIK